MKCVYCENEADSNDHIPPKSMFPSGSNDLFTVPSCIVCNGKWGLDDEYVRNIFAMGEHIEGDVRLNGIINKSIRSLLRPEAKKLHDMIIDTVFVEPRYDGVDKIGFTVDADRIINWSKRIMVGIYYIENSIKIEMDKTMSFMLNTIFNMNELSELVNAVGGYMNGNAPRISGNGIFKFWTYAEKDNYAIIFSLYDKYIFCGMMCAPNQIIAPDSKPNVPNQ